MAFGTFDLFHEGHRNFLSQARKLGNSLVVVVARDSTVRKVKGRDAVDSELTRVKNVKASGLAGRVLLGSAGNKYDVIRKERPDIICLGYDQSSFVDGLSGFLKSEDIDAVIVRLRAHMPHKYKTSLLRKKQNKGSRAKNCAADC